VNEYYDYFGPDFKLDVRSSNMEDKNSVEYLERIKNVVLEHLREIGGPPGVQMTGAYLVGSHAQLLPFPVHRGYCVSDFVSK
jgi:hypothetical protein